MATRFLPIVLPTWAESEEFPAGVHPWSGAPNKVEIIAAQRNVGQQPDSQIAGVHYNWMNHRYARGYEVLFHDAMQRWVGHRPHVVENIVVDSDNYDILSLHIDVGDTIGVCPPNYTQKAAPAVPLMMLAGTNIATILVSTSGAQFVDVEHIADSPVIDIAGFPGVQIALSDSARHIYRSLNFGETWAALSNITPADSTFLSLLISGDRALASIQGAGDNSGERIYVSDDSGATWDPVDIGLASLTITAWASNGNDVIVAYATNAGFGGMDLLIYSTDNGDTWNTGDTAGAALQVASVAYSPEWDQFLVVNGEGKLWTTSNGAGWVERSGMNFLPVGIRALAAVGPVFAMVTNAALTPSPDARHASGVLYTIDCGETWHFVPLGIVDPDADGLKTIRALGGRFITGGRGQIFLSGHLWMPEPDQVIV